MNKKHIKKEYVIGASIIIFGLILSAGFIIVQHNKQVSIERQLEMKIAQENKVLEEKREEEKRQKLAERVKEFKLESCLKIAEDDYWTYVELNGKGKRDDEKGVWAQTWVWDTAKKDKQTAIDNCYKRYK
jgi:hypothetical protein